MKKITTLLLFVLASVPFIASAQTGSADFQKGSILTGGNEKVEGVIKDLTKNKGTILFESSTGRKTLYTPAEILGYTLNGTNYISYASDFYKVIVPAGKAALYQRVTDNSGKMLYNGAEVVSVTTAEGKAGDYYIELKADGKLILVSQKNFEAAISTAFAGCATVVTEIKSKQSGYAQIAAVVGHYNSCN